MLLLIHVYNIIRARVCEYSFDECNVKSIHLARIATVYRGNCCAASASVAAAARRFVNRRWTGK